MMVVSLSQCLIEVAALTGPSILVPHANTVIVSARRLLADVETAIEAAK
jgi:hypothetical protein